MKILAPNRQGVFLRASLSSVCNFSCGYCAADLGMENHTPRGLCADLLTAKQYVKNLELIARHGFKNVSFTGGEPLLNPEFEQVARECRGIFETVEITTNGSFVSKHLDTLKKYVDVLKISADAFDADLAVKIAGSKAAADTLCAVEECCRSGIKTVGLNFVYMRQNSEELPKLIDFAAALKKKYSAEVYISVLDLYYSPGNREFWQEQFVRLSEVRERLSAEGFRLTRRERTGCDSYYFERNGVRVNMKDSLSRTCRADFCADCASYCQEGIYSLKHSASGWIGVCPTNDPRRGAMLSPQRPENEAHGIIDPFIDTLNEIRPVENSGKLFIERNNL